jgi:hypothetical protein
MTPHEALIVYATGAMVWAIVVSLNIFSWSREPLHWTMILAHLISIALWWLALPCWIVSLVDRYRARGAAAPGFWASARRLWGLTDWIMGR